MVGCEKCSLGRYLKPDGTSVCSDFNNEMGISDGGPLLSPVKECDHPLDFHSRTPAEEVGNKVDLLEYENPFC